MDVDPFVDPLQFLTECHARIRLRLDSLRRIAWVLRRRGAVPRHELEAALLFFRSSGVAHTRDEEDSLFPRLRRRLTERGQVEAVAAVDGLEAEHRDHDQAMQGMIAAMHTLDPTLGSGDGLPHPEAPLIITGTALSSALAEAMDLVVDHYEAHLPVENDVLFPLARQVLPREDIEAIAREMRERHRLGRRLLVAVGA